MNQYFLALIILYVKVCADGLYILINIGVNDDNYDCSNVFYRIGMTM
jgi:hypothetical protein